MLTTRRWQQSSQQATTFTSCLSKKKPRTTQCPTTKAAAATTRQRIRPPLLPRFSPSFPPSHGRARRANPYTHKSGTFCTYALAPAARSIPAHICRLGPHAASSTRVDWCRSLVPRFRGGHVASSRRLPPKDCDRHAHHGSPGHQSSGQFTSYRRSIRTLSQSNGWSGRRSSLQTECCYQNRQEEAHRFDNEDEVRVRAGCRHCSISLVADSAAICSAAACLASKTLSSIACIALCASVIYAVFTACGSVLSVDLDATQPVSIGTQPVSMGISCNDHGCSDTTQPVSTGALLVSIGISSIEGCFATTPPSFRRNDSPSAATYPDGCPKCF